MSTELMKLIEHATSDWTHSTLVPTFHSAVGLGAHQNRASDRCYTDQV